MLKTYNMPNKQSVEIYIKRADIEDILNDTAVTHILVRGDIEVIDETNCNWNIVASGFPDLNESAAGRTTCPHPCL